MAEALFNSLSPAGHSASSAGSLVDLPGETLTEYRTRVGADHSFVIPVMCARGLDVSLAKRSQLSGATVKQEWNFLISMAEPAVTPPYLSEDARFRYWDVPDPGGRSLAATSETESLILRFVQRLLDEIWLAQHAAALCRPITGDRYCG